jgi:gamma-glutamylcyclotransferase
MPRERISRKRHSEAKLPDIAVELEKRQNARANSIYEAEGRPQGQQDRHWQQARYLPIFAYGSSMNSSVMRRRCPGAEFLFTASLPNRELCFPRRSSNRNSFVAGYRDAIGRSVWGVVWAIPEIERNSLDDAEGYRPGRLDGNSYERVPVSVWFSDGTAATVETYRAIPHEGGRPSKPYLDLIIAGAEDHSLPIEYINQLKWYFYPTYVITEDGPTREYAAVGDVRESQKDALGFLKDWILAILTFDTAILTGVGAFVGLKEGQSSYITVL